jgi:hypothetical protein
MCREVQNSLARSRPFQLRLAGRRVPELHRGTGTVLALSTPEPDDSPRFLPRGGKRPESYRSKVAARGVLTAVGRLWGDQDR